MWITTSESRNWTLRTRTLDWRLWVGKKTLTAAPPLSRSVVRTRARVASILPCHLESRSCALRNCDLSVKLAQIWKLRLVLPRSSSLVNYKLDSKRVTRTYPGWVSRCPFLMFLSIYTQVPHTSSNGSSGSSTSSPETPSIVLFLHPGERTIQISYEVGCFRLTARLNQGSIWTNRGLPSSPTPLIQSCPV
jgi:hypothetical protein